MNDLAILCEPSQFAYNPDTAASNYFMSVGAISSYDAVQQVNIGEKEVATIIDALCKGEGACVPICPQEAIDIKGYSDAQILSMIEAFGKEIA